MKARLWWVGVASASLLLQAVQAEAYRTPRAGEAYHTEIWSKQVTAPARDRRHVTALNLGLQYIPDGPSSPDILPFGGARHRRPRRGRAATVWGDLRVAQPGAGPAALPRGFLRLVQRRTL